MYMYIYAENAKIKVFYVWSLTKMVDKITKFPRNNCRICI